VGRGSPPASSRAVAGAFLVQHARPDKCTFVVVERLHPKRAYTLAHPQTKPVPHPESTPRTLGPKRDVDPTSADLGALVQADGSGMYTLQALWTQQREMLHVVTVVCANQTYNILKIEQTKQKLPTTGQAAAALTSLRTPALDWVQLAQGHGVRATRVKTVDEFADAFSRALVASGPSLIEAMLC